MMESSSSYYYYYYYYYYYKQFKNGMNMKKVHIKLNKSLKTVRQVHI